jgi:aminopeptidase 2
MDVKDPAEISEIFDAVTYDTGSMSVRTLYNFVGADKFFEGLRVYFQRYAYESTTTKELWLVFEEVTGLPITDVMRNFVLRNGYPYVYAEVESASSPAVVALESRRFTYPWSHNGSAWPDTLSTEDAVNLRDAARTGFAAACRLSTSLNAGWTPSADDTDDWNIPLSVLYADVTGAQHSVIATTIILDESSASHGPETRGKTLTNAVTKVVSTIPADAKWVKLNSGQSMLYRVLYGPHFLAHILLHFHDFPKADRVGLVDDVAAASAGGMIACDSFFQLALAIKDESAYDVWHRIVYWLLRAYSLISAGEDREYTGALATFIQSVLREQIRRLGWHPLPIESTDSAMLRGLLLGAAIKVGDADAVANALQEFNAYADSGVLLDPELKSMVYLAAARFGGEEAFEKLLKLYRATDNAEEQRKLLQALGNPSTPELLKRVLAWSLTPEVKNSEVDTVFASASEATWAQGPRLTWEFTCEQWPELLRRFGKGTFLLPYLVDAMCSSSFSSRETYAEVERFFQMHEHPGAERRVSLILEEIRDRAWRREVLVQAKEKVVEKLAC